MARLLNRKYNLTYDIPTLNKNQSISYLPFTSSTDIDAPKDKIEEMSLNEVKAMSNLKDSSDLDISHESSNEGFQSFLKRFMKTIPNEAKPFYFLNLGLLAYVGKRSDKGFHATLMLELCAVS